MKEEGRTDGRREGVSREREGEGKGIQGEGGRMVGRPGRDEVRWRKGKERYSEQR